MQSDALGVSVPAVKSLLVRARLGLAQANEARDTACVQIREDVITAHDRGVRASGLARRHLRDCSECRRFRHEMRSSSRQLAALIPALGPIAVAAKLLGFSVGGGAAGAAGGTGAQGAAVGTSAAVGTGSPSARARRRYGTPSVRAQRSAPAPPSVVASQPAEASWAGRPAGWWAPVTSRP